MDPNANLAEQRELANKILVCSDREHEAALCTCRGDGERLAELMQALDEWIKRGGFKPDAWRK